MKHLQLLGLFLCAVWLAGCGTGGNQEAKRRAAMAQEQQQVRGDESDQNLRSAQQNILRRDNNPARKP
jgi:hypothetical protein